MYKVNVNNVLVLAFSNQYDCVRFQQLVCGCEDLVFRDYNERTDLCLPEIDMESYQSEYAKLAIFWKEFSCYFTILHPERAKKVENITSAKTGGIPINVKPFYSYMVSYQIEAKPAPAPIRGRTVLFDTKVINTHRELMFDGDLKCIREAILKEESLSDLEYAVYILRIDRVYYGAIPDDSLEVKIE